MSAYKEFIRVLFVNLIFWETLIILNICNIALIKKKILFLTTANLTTNPRLLKELSLAMEYYDVDFTGFSLGNWSDKMDRDQLDNLNIKAHYISATRSPLIPWLVSSLVQRICFLFYNYAPQSLALSSFASQKRSFLLYLYLNKFVRKKYDLIIAHNLGALYPAYSLAKKTGAKFAFDIEDFHPGETIRTDAKNEVLRRKFLMSRILAKASYVSYASPLIGTYSLSIIPRSENRIDLLINNCFSKTEFINQGNTANQDNVVDFVWFSQNIDYGRGLELAIQALLSHKEKSRLTLIGQVKEDFYKKFIEPYKDFISVIAPIRQPELHKILAKYDVGLAVDLSSADFNREIALTNKIFSYLQSGLYILATDTQAQKRFILENEGAGICSNQTIEGMINGIGSIIANIKEIRKLKAKRYAQGQNYCWETESIKLIETWDNVMMHEYHHYP